MLADDPNAVLSEQVSFRNVSTRRQIVAASKERMNQVGLERSTGLVISQRQNKTIKIEKVENLSPEVRTFQVTVSISCNIFLGVQIFETSERIFDIF